MSKRLNVGRSPVDMRMPGEWWVAMVAIALLVGWRHEVGGDWFNYLRNFENTLYDSRNPEWWTNDPGYRLLEWTASYFGWGVHGANLVAGSIFSFGLIVFCRHLPRPWLALAVSIPYLVIILGMGYSRQGVALGCLMIGLVGLGNGRLLVFLFWTLLGATFHKSAVLLFPVAALASSEKRIYSAIWVAVSLAAAYVLLLEDSVSQLRTNYLEAGYQSEGAMVRLLMNSLPAMLLLSRRSRFSVSLPQERLWFWFSVASLGMLGAFFLSPSSTAVDRVALYLLPLQLMVFSFLPEAFGNKSGKGNQDWVLAVLLYYGLVELVWLNFATHAFAWIPYRWYPFVALFPQS